MQDTIGQDASFAVELGSDEVCSALRLERDDIWEEDAEGGTDVLDMGADEESSGLGLDFDEIGRELGYNGVSFVEGFSDIVSSDAGLESDENRRVTREDPTSFLQCVSCNDTSGMCLDLSLTRGDRASYRGSPVVTLSITLNMVFKHLPHQKSPCNTLNANNHFLSTS